MIRIYKNINTDGEHRLVGTPSNFSTAFSSNKIYETNDVGKFVQPNAREIIVPYFADFKSASIIESVVTFTNNQNDYTFFRVTGYEFSGINNIKYYIVVDPFLTFNITVSGLLYQTSDVYKYSGIYASPAIKGNSFVKKRRSFLFGYDEQSDSYKYILIAYLNTNLGVKIFTTEPDTFKNTKGWAWELAHNNQISENTTPFTYTYEVVHIYILPFEFAFQHESVQWFTPYISGRYYKIDESVHINKAVQKTITVDKNKFNCEVGTISKRIVLPDFRLMYSFSGTDNDISFDLLFDLSSELDLVIRLYAGGQYIEIQDDFEVDLVYSAQSQYDAFKRMANNIRLASRFIVGGATTISSIQANNAMAAVSGGIKIGEDIAGIFANNIEREKQTGTIITHAGNVVENITQTKGIALFYNDYNDLENKKDVDDANALYGYIPLNLITCTDDPLASPIAPSGTYIYYKFSQITDISDGNIPLEYIEEIKSDLLRGVFVLHY